MADLIEGSVGEGEGGGRSLLPILGKEEEMVERKAGRARKTKLPLKLDLPLI